MSVSTILDNAPISRPGPRPGGRSARVQAAVHAAVRELQASEGRDSLTVPAIATRAGVTPSTIYRRWGDLGQLLADVAVELLRPESAPAQMGSYEADLRAWLEQYAEEMSSTPGRALLIDVLNTPRKEGAGRCLFFCTKQIDAIRERAEARGEHTVPTIDIVDRALAPIMYRILFAAEAPTQEDIGRWLALALL